MPAWLLPLALAAGVVIVGAMTLACLIYVLGAGHPDEP